MLLGEISYHRYGRVVWPIEGAVEFPEFFDRYLFDIGSPTDDRVMVRMRFKSCRKDFFGQRAPRAVLASLVFVTDYYHLRFTIFLPKRQVAHSIGFKLSH